jgi:hypothetical protein
VIFVIATMAGAGEGAAVSRRITGNVIELPDKSVIRTLLSQCCNEVIGWTLESNRIQPKMDLVIAVVLD